MISLVRGDTWNLSWTYLNEDNTPVDLTGASFRMHMKKFYDSLPILEFTNEDFTVDIDEGIISLTILPIVSETLSGSYIYDIEVTFPDSTVKTIIIDEIKVRKDVTQ